MTLVLYRNPGERIFIHTPDGERIIVTLVRVDAAGARLGFDAPESYRIAREELEDDSSIGSEARCL